MEAAIDILERHEVPPVDSTAPVQASTAWLAAEVQKGLDDLTAGRVVSQEEVERRLREKGFRV